MHVISKKPLRDFWDKHADAKSPLVEWHARMKRAQYATHHDVQKDLPKVSILKGGRVVFNIGGNKYRLVVCMDYVRQWVYVKFVGTHKEYDAIDAETV
ncbi:type II toxin-antitoxin system HigB family toxin [Pseudomonas sp. zjy_15]|uniref:type II toxin-antitoxin system HigB family toxin n=1 Tax=unclassified Pseudomonas TaxID=196821 RepID=UPI00370B47F4